VVQSETVPDEQATPGAHPCSGLRPVRRSARRLGVALAAIALVALSSCGGGTARAGGSTATPRFVDETSSSGIDHRYTGDFSYFVGGGVATFDCNGDGRPDLYFAGGSGPAALYRNESAVGGALRFAPEPSPVTDLVGVTGAYPLDVDGDGHVDLVVLRNGLGNVLLRGLGDCRFEAANERSVSTPATIGRLGSAPPGRDRTASRRWPSAATSCPAPTTAA
jgi:hypothetical protein